MFGAFALASTGLQDQSLESQVDAILQDLGSSGYIEQLEQIPSDDSLSQFGAYFDENTIDGDIANLIFDAQQDLTGNIDLRNGRFFTLGTLEESVSPAVFAKYCADYPDDCTRTNSEEVTVNMEQLESIKSFNAAYYDEFIYASSLETHRVLDQWSPAEQLDDVNPMRSDLRIGKCVQYTLGVINESAEAFGIDRSSMSMMVVDPHDESGDLHSVLVVRTIEGDYIADNNGRTEPAREYLEEQGYTPIQMQSFHDKTFWHKAEMTPVGVMAESTLLPDPVDVGGGPRRDPRSLNGLGF